MSEKNHDWTKEYQSLGDLHKINSQIFYEHVTKPDVDRTYYIERLEEGWKVHVVSDSTMQNFDTVWRLEYGAIFRNDGSVKTYLSTYREPEAEEAYAEKIAQDIFPTLLERSIDHYLEK